MNQKTLSVLLVLVLTAGTFAGVFWKKFGQLEAEKQVLQTRVQELERSLDEARNETKQAASFSTRDSQAQKSELMRLRNDVTQLRESDQTARKFETENLRLIEENQKLRSQTAEAGQQYRQQLQAQEAKIAQLTRTNQASDPLEFYRKNPELMKRYFPHLAGEATNQVRFE